MDPHTDTPTVPLPTDQMPDAERIAYLRTFLLDGENGTSWNPRFLPASDGLWLCEKAEKGA